MRTYYKALNKKVAALYAAYIIALSVAFYLVNLYQLGD